MHTWRLPSAIRVQFMNVGSNSALIIILFGQWDSRSGSDTSLFTELTKGHRLTWNGPKAFLSPVLHQAEGYIFHIVVIIAFDILPIGPKSCVDCALPITAPLPRRIEEVGVP